MRRDIYLTIILFLCILFMVVPRAFGGKALYDDFSGTYLDIQKWQNREFVREVAEGKLVSKIGNASGTGTFRNSTRFQNPDSITTIECDITIVTTNLDTGSGPSSYASIAGFFYNTQASGGATGDIVAVVSIGDGGNGGLEAHWGLYEYLDDNLTNAEEKGSGTLIDPGGITSGIAYTAKIEYDGNNGFQFTVAGASESLSGPSRQRAAVTEFKGLTTVINANGGSGIGYVSALFDNVNTNTATPYDDFSTAPLDQTKWQDWEFVREISNGKLRLNTEGEDAWTDAILAPVNVNQSTAYLETKVLVESGSEVSSGAWGRAQIKGRYYNESRGPGSGQAYNGSEGDVLALIGIRIDDSSILTADFVLSISDDAEATTWTTRDYHQFTTTIDFDAEYTLSIEFNGSSFIFKCNDETYQYDVTTPMYPPSTGQTRNLSSMIFADTGQSGYMKACPQEMCMSRPVPVVATETISMNGLMAIVVRPTATWLLRSR